MDEPAAAIPGDGLLLGLALGAVARLAQRLAPDASSRAPGRSGRGPPGSPKTVRQADALAAADRGGPCGRRRRARPAKTRIITTIPMLWMSALGDELEDRQRLRALRAVRGVHEEGEEGGQGQRERRAQGRPQVHEAGEPGHVVAGDRVAAGGRHELARVGLGGAAVRALAAVVAAPELLAGEERVLHPDLGVADHPPREGRVVLRERADRGAVAAAEAGAHVGRAVPLQLRVEADVGQGGHARSSAW